VLDGMFVIDATVHPYNLTESNLLRDGSGPSKYAVMLREMLWAMHYQHGNPDAKIAREPFVSDWSPEVLAWTLFTESPTDIAVNHCLRIDRVFADGLCSHRKNAELARRWPNRMIPYAGINPVNGLRAALDDLRQQVDEIPGTVGLKVYPNAGTPDHTWRMDDPEWTPLFELALELGLKVIAVHKVVPNGLVPLRPFAIDDLEMRALMHPELTFEIVHAGLPPFVEEVALAIMRLPNVYANLEITSAILERGMGYIVDSLAQMIGMASAYKIIYSSGAMHFHPRPIVEAIANLQFPDHLLERYNMPQLTRQDKEQILGLNFARIIGLDVEEAKRSIADDEFSHAVAENGLQPPWTYWRKNDPLWDGVAA
jgi:predicted TIM-barrel fold metal-dependent hydrolase